jgi:transposase
MALTPGAWERAYREKRRLRAGELFEQGTPNVLIAEALGVTGSAVSMWRGVWEEGGIEALRSLGRPGYPRLLTEKRIQALIAELECGAVAHGFETERWTLSRVNEVIEGLFGVCFADDSGVWRLLKRIGWSAHRAGRGSAARDPEAIERSRDVTWPRILDRARAAGTWIVFEDEAAAMLNARGASTRGQARQTRVAHDRRRAPAQTSDARLHLPPTRRTGPALLRVRTRRLLHRGRPRAATPQAPTWAPGA